MPLSIAQLPEALRELTPHFLANLISFSVIGIFWIRHPRMFGYIQRLGKPAPIKQSCPAA
jgi:uncharacterized membrane protein